MDSSFCAWGVWRKILKNKWFSLWMELSETISSVYTPAVETRRAWASWSAGSGGDGALWVTSVHKWLPVRNEEGGKMGGGAIFCAVKTSGKTWMLLRDTSSTCFRSVHNLPAKREREREGREVEISLNSSVSARVVEERIVRSAVNACVYVTHCADKSFSTFMIRESNKTGTLNLSCRAQLKTVPIQNTCFWSFAATCRTGATLSCCGDVTSPADKPGVLSLNHICSLQGHRLSRGRRGG